MANPWLNPQGINFRNSLAYVTDPAGTVGFPNSGSGFNLRAYPYSVTANGATFNCGWDAYVGNEDGARDDSVLTGVAAELAGINGITATGSPVGIRAFSIQLPAAGTYLIWMALGRAAGGSSQTYAGGSACGIYDGGTIGGAYNSGGETLLRSLTYGTTTTSTWFDAAGNLLNQTNWVASNGGTGGGTPILCTFKTAVCKLVLGTSAGAIAHLRIQQVSSYPNFRMYANGAFQSSQFIETNVGAISFNGSTQYLSATNSGGWLTSGGSWTVESWIYIPSLSATYTQIAIVANNTGVSNAGWTIRLNSTALGNPYTSVSFLNGGGTSVVTFNYTFSLNTWYHIACVSTGSGNIQFYINGVSISLTSGTTVTFTEQTAIYVGRNGTNSANYGYFPGYITNLRIVNGTALYTSNFTPPISPLLPVTNTQLLLDVVDSTNYIKDSSPNNFTVTPVGSPTFVSNHPFLSGMKMNSNSTVQIGNLIESIGCGSISFDGATQELDISSISTITGTGTFTIEAWVYPLDYSDEIIGSGSSDSNLQIFRLNENGSGGAPAGISVYDNGTQVFQNVGTGTYPVANKWTHLAWVKTGTTNTLYINGISSATYTGNVPNFTPNIIGVFYYLGSANAYWFKGYITNYRIVNGTAVYTSNFTPPSRPAEATQSANFNGNPSAAITGTQTVLSLAVLSSSTYLTDSSTNNLTVTPINSPTFSTLSPVTNPGTTTQTNKTQKLYSNSSFLSTQFIEQ